MRFTSSESIVGLRYGCAVGLYADSGTLRVETLEHEERKV